MVENSQNEEKHGGNLNRVSTIAPLAVAGVDLTTLVAFNGLSPPLNSSSASIDAGIGKLFTLIRGRFRAIYCATCKTSQSTNYSVYCVPSKTNTLGLKGVWIETVRKPFNSFIC